MITLSTGAPDGWQHVWKRALDISLSLLALLLLSPVFLLAALVVKLTSPGPVFFVQDRVGLNKHRFPMIKFRTMVADAERRQREIESLNEATGPVFKIRNDPRITPVGAFLRKTSIDELPQLFNVLKGDRASSAPAPSPSAITTDSTRIGSAAASPSAPASPASGKSTAAALCAFEKWMELDMHYIDHWSLGLDFKILAKTIPAVLRAPAPHDFQLATLPIKRRSLTLRH